MIRLIRARRLRALERLEAEVHAERAAIAAEREALRSVVVHVLAREVPARSRDDRAAALARIGASYPRGA